MKKVQRIKMKIHGHPVKHDGTILGFDESNGSFRVEFDGPLPNKTFWPWSKQGGLVTDMEPIRHPGGGLGLPEGAQLWEVI